MKLQKKTGFDFTIFPTVSTNPSLANTERGDAAEATDTPYHNACHLKSGVTGPDGPNPFDIWPLLSYFCLINCWIRPFTRSHKCQQMSRKCQGQEGDSGYSESVQIHKRQWKLGSSIPAEMLGATFLFLSNRCYNSATMYTQWRDQ